MRSKWIDLHSEFVDNQRPVDTCGIFEHVIDRMEMIGIDDANVMNGFPTDVGVQEWTLRESGAGVLLYLL